MQQAKITYPFPYETNAYAPALEKKNQSVD